MNTLVFFLEGQSAHVMLQGLLTRLLPRDWQFKYICFEGKQDLEKQLLHQLQKVHYRS